MPVLHRQGRIGCCRCHRHRRRPQLPLLTIPAGRGEPIKLALAVAGVVFEVADVDYNEMKHNSEKYPFAQVWAGGWMGGRGPVLEAGGRPVPGGLIAMREVVVVGRQPGIHLGALQQAAALIKSCASILRQPGAPPTGHFPASACPQCPRFVDEDGLDLSQSNTILRHIG